MSTEIEPPRLSDAHQPELAESAALTTQAVLLDSQETVLHQPVQTVSADKNPDTRSGARSHLVLLMVAAVVAGGLWLFLRSGTRADSEPSTAAVAELERLDVPKGEASPVKEGATEQATLQPPADVPSKVIEEPVPAQGREAVPEPSPPPGKQIEAQGDTAAAASGSGETIVVTVTAIPADARFFYKGKSVGRSPLRVELKPGERRAFEIGRPGYYARKVVVDGRKREMTVSMRPEAR